MMDITFLGPREDQHVVQVDKDKSVDDIPEHVVWEMLGVSSSGVMFGGFSKAKVEK